MFSFLFGAPKKTAPAPFSVDVDSTIATLRMLSGKESDLEKRIAMLEKQVDTLKAEAVAVNAAGHKQRAMLLLKKKSMYEDQIKTNNAMLFKIVEQKMALESTMINAGALSAMSAATESMKASQAVWSPDAIHDLTEEMAEVNAAHREVVDLLREPLSADGPTEDDLMAELDELAAAAAPPAPAAAAPAPAAAPIALDLPAVPTAPVPVASTVIHVAAKPKGEMEAMLEAL